MRVFVLHTCISRCCETGLLYWCIFLLLPLHDTLMQLIAKICFVLRLVASVLYSGARFWLPSAELCVERSGTRRVAANRSSARPILNTVPDACTKKYHRSQSSATILREFRADEESLYNRHISSFVWLCLPVELTGI